MASFLRKSLLCWTALCIAIAPNGSAADPHAEGVAAGEAANPVARGAITEADAAAVVPGYTTTPPEMSYYRQPNLAAQANGRLAACAIRRDDPTCQAQLGALRSANTPRPVLGALDPAVAAAQAIARSPSSVLENLASYYSGCTTTTTQVPAGTQTRSCLRYEGIGNYRCTRSLTVTVERTTNCTPGEWFAHASSGRTGLDVQCLPDRPETAQHFRVTQDAVPLAYFDVDMTTPLAFPEMVAVLRTTYSGRTGMPVRTGVWVADKSCTGETCELTAMIAAESKEFCPGGSGDDGGLCTSVEPFLKRFGACASGTQSGDLIQHTDCPGDDGCSTTTLDGTKCYAPAAGPTPYVGRDVTGTYPGDYWTLEGDRTIVGWDPNPAYGPILTMRLSYTRPQVDITEADRWDDQCPSSEGAQRCSALTTAVCTDGPSTKVIDGANVTRDCWGYETTLRCQGASPMDQCAPLAAAGCELRGSVCQRANAISGLCEVHEDSYACPTPAQTVTSASNCPSNVFCLQGSCFDIAHASDGDFARSMSMLEAAREAGVYLNTDRMEVFRGENNRCRDRLLKNCCYADSAGAGMTNQSIFGAGSRLVYDILMNAENQQFIYQGMSALLLGEGFSGSFTTYGVTVAVNGTALPTGSVVLYAGDSIVVAFDPWTLVIAVVIYIVMSMMSCDEEEGKLAMKEGAGLCHSVGSYCSSCIRVFGSCVSCITHTTRKCCFNSMLARIVQQQGRTQVGKVWGTAENPDCSGFTVAELQSLDFAAMDLSEFYASLVPTMPDLAAWQNQGASRVPSCYYGQGQCQ